VHCCAPGCCLDVGGGRGDSPVQAASVVGYEICGLESVPEASILEVGCEAPLKFADLRKGETVVDLGSRAGIDVFLSARKIGDSGKAIGIDFTVEILERARRNENEGIQIKTSEFAAFLGSFLLFSAKNQQMNGHIIIWRLYYNALYEAE
jgi:hypothetical protein